jgi:hypothetical protein
MVHPFVGVPIYQSPLAVSHKIRLHTMLGSGATARLAAALVAAGCDSGSSCHRTLCAIVLRVASRRGAVELMLRQDDGTPAGAVFIPFAFVEAAANELTHAALDRLQPTQP